MSNSDKYKAYEVVYHLFQKHVGSITMPAKNPDHAIEKIKQILGDDYKDLVIDSCTDIEDTPAFKTMVASVVINAENEQAAFDRWLNEAIKEDKEASTTETPDEATGTTKTVH